MGLYEIFLSIILGEYLIEMVWTSIPTQIWNSIPTESMKSFYPITLLYKQQCFRCSLKLQGKEKNSNGNEFEQSPRFSIDRNPALATFKFQSSMQKLIKTLVLFQFHFWFG